MGEVVENQDVRSQRQADDNTWRLDINRFRPTRREPLQDPKARNGCLNQRFGKTKKVKEYYEHQQEVYNGYLEMDKLDGVGTRWVPDTTHEEREKIKKGEKFAIRLSNICNLIIFIAKILASVKSMSLAIIASTLDSFLDLLSGFILWFVTHSMRKRNPYVYPIGKKRMQPLGILVFSVIMATLGLQIIIESVRQLLSSGPHTMDLKGAKLPWVVGIMTGTSVVKLGLMLYCWTFKNEIVRTYGKDHMFDVITNVVGLGAALLATWFYWWIDPTGAIILALYTMRTWSMTAVENVRALNSRTASPDFLAKLAYLAWNHHKSILYIDTVRAYTLGTHAFVEVDIVLPRDMSFKDTHDIGESLQNKIESLPEVERAFVHLDFSYDHKPEHAVPDYELNLNLPQPNPEHAVPDHELNLNLPQPKPESLG